MTIGTTWVSQASHSIQQHPRRLAALVGFCLLGAGGGAFAIASFGPDPSDLPVNEVLQTVEPLTTELLGNAQDIHQFSLFRTETIRSSDTVNALLQRLGVSDAEAASFMRSDRTAQQGLFSRAGRTVFAETTNDNQLRRITARWAQDGDPVFQRLVIEKTDAGWQSRIETAPLEASTRLGSATIRSSLFAATDEANIPDAVAVQVAELFSSDINFRRSLQRGDRLSVVYETLEADGEPLRTGRVLSAEFTNNGKTFDAIWFQDGNKKGTYYTLDGRSMTRSFLAAPLAFSRVTSGFAMRFHPIQKTWRAHLGTDFGAPTGTPVRTVGDGKVDFAGVQNGYGNVVFVNHGNNKVTVYAHLSKIGVRVGESVTQGQNIGAVGATGWATGPHLHFEFRVNGKQQDPQIIAQQGEATPVSDAARPEFDKLASAMRMSLSVAAQTQQASAQ